MPFAWTRTRGRTALGVAIVALAAVVAMFAAPSEDTTGERLAAVALGALVVAAPVITGLCALADARTARFGWALLGAAGVWAVGALGAAGDSLSHSTGRVAAWAALPLVAFLLLSFPDGRLRRLVDRRLVLAFAAVVLVLFVAPLPFVERFDPVSPWTQCGNGCPGNAFQLVAEPGIVGSVIVPLREVLVSLLLAGTTLLLARRVLGTGRLGRATDKPALLAAAASTAVLVAFLTLRDAVPASGVTDAMGLAWMLCLPAISGAFWAGLMRRRLVLATVLGRLTRELGAFPAARELRGALRASLEDESAEILTRDRPRGAWLTCDGATVTELALARRGLTLHEIWDDDGPVAAVVLDADLDAEDELVTGVVGLVEAALREARLADELSVSLSALDASRRRIATAADHERRRIERDLHDGAQQRLIALRMRLSIAEDLLDRDPAAASTAIHAMGEDVDLALDEIRALAHGIYPALLADRGLVDALESVARRLPLRVDVRTNGAVGRQSPEVEAAVYFTCVEALQNVVKHARGATCARIVLHRGTALEFHVSDDGVGFDPPRRHDGAGMRNMRDRIESVDGSFTVRSWPGRGTAVYGRVPLDVG